MKKSGLICLLLFPLLTYAQNNNVQSAANSLKLDDVANAKKWIDLASEHEQTSNVPKMWYYRGKTYMEIHTIKKWNSLDEFAIEKAVQSFLNCIKTDSKKLYTDDCKKLVWVAGVELFNKAYEFSQKVEVKNSIRYYQLVQEIFPHDADNNLKRNNITDDIVERNIAYTALKGRDLETAKVHFQKLIDRNFNDPKIYLNMAKVHLEQNDTANALKYIEKGKDIFEDYMPLLTEEMNIFLAQGRTDELISKLSASIENNPDNEMLYLNRGLMYEGKKNIELAEADYKKVIEINSENPDANYNLGVLYFNQAATMANAANNIKSNEEFAKAKVQFELKFKQAEPFLEKALDLNPGKTEDEIAMQTATLNSLRQLYVRTGEMEKYEKLKVQMEKE